MSSRQIGLMSLIIEVANCMLSSFFLYGYMKGTININSNCLKINVIKSVVLINISSEKKHNQ